jgi:hypothetical protein
MKTSFGWKYNAGLIRFDWKAMPFHGVMVFKHSLHLFVKKPQWMWGASEEEYDRSGNYFGLGPLFLKATLKLENS